jgi:hypothetical protein
MSLRAARIVVRHSIDQHIVSDALESRFRRNLTRKEGRFAVKGKRFSVGQR